MFKSDSIDSSFIDEFSWLSETITTPPPTTATKENLGPRADVQLVRLFKSVNDQGTTIPDTEIIAYINKVCILFLMRNAIFIFHLLEHEPN